MTQSTSSQRKDLYRLFGYCKETEALHVMQMTNGRSKTAKDLSIHQADLLKKKLVTNWAVFNKENKKHLYILSLLRQLGWTIMHPKFGEVADMQRLSNFLKSKKSPVPKPLQDMDKHEDKGETSKLISCLESMVTKAYM